MHWSGFVKTRMADDWTIHRFRPHVVFVLTQDNWLMRYFDRLCSYKLHVVLRIPLIT
jgi:hypothetical protein